MSANGTFSPLGSSLGSGTSHAENVYVAMRSAVGTSASPVGGLDDLWRQARAIGKASSQLSVDRAAYQAIPVGATDHIPPYERLLALATSSWQTEEDRRQRIVAAWTRTITSTSRGIEIDLQEISPLFSLVPTDHDQTDTVHQGRTYPPRGLEASYGTTQYPNFSTAFVTQVKYDVPSGATEIPADELADAETLLDASLPAWVDFVISQEGPSGAGFYADGGPDGTSVADYTAIY
jgi:hypothetical protein